MQSVAAFPLAFFVVAAAAVSALAQKAQVTARLSASQTVTVTAAPVTGEGVLLEFNLPDGRLQSFPQLGEALVPIDGKPGGAGLLAKDLNDDSVDEVILRGSVPPDRGAVLIFRWDQAGGEYIPIEFTDDRDRTTKFLVVDPKEPVLIDSAGNIEAQFETVRQDGRTSSHVARYRWNGKAYTQSTDN